VSHGQGDPFLSPAAVAIDELENGLSECDRLAAKLDAKRYTDSLLSFVRDAWPILEPAQTFVENWHIGSLCHLLEDIAAGREPRTIINVPPGTMKSLLVSVIFPCWLWARDPKKRILTAAYSDKRALDANIKARNLIKSPWFQKHFTLTLVEDQNTKGRFDTTEGGWRIATSVGGEGTGLHPDLIIIDDAATAADAQSETERKTVNTWFSATVSTRGVSRNVTIIVIGQRLHQEDLPGYLLAKDRTGWTLVRWPMRFEKCTCPADLAEREEDRRCALHKADPEWTADPRDPRTEPGELLFPTLFDEAKVRKLELDLGPIDSAGQLQQRPSAEGGTLFKRETFKFIDALPKLVKWVRGWDLAASEGKGDYTAGVKIGIEYEWRIENGLKRLLDTGRIIVGDVQHDQLGPDAVDKLMKVTAELDGKSVPIRAEKEGGASGVAASGAQAKMLRGWDFEAVHVGTNKVLRARPFRAQVEAGNVFLLRAGWNEKYITELCAFPTGKHDDLVDASSCAFNAVLLEPAPKKVELTW
jgi:predicted phage terminase large subunit-like protein